MVMDNWKVLFFFYISLLPLSVDSRLFQGAHFKREINPCGYDVIGKEFEIQGKLLCIAKCLSTRGCLSVSMEMKDDVHVCVLLTRGFKVFLDPGGGDTDVWTKEICQFWMVYDVNPSEKHFMVFNSTPLTYHNARTQCQGRMAEMKTPEKNDAVLQYLQAINTNLVYWFGLVYSGAGSQVDYTSYQWQQSQTTLSYHFFDGGEPSNNGHCNRWRKKNGIYKWGNRGCGTQYPFICEFKISVN